MKKLLDFIKFFTKAFLLIFLLILGWAFINVTNLIKGKKAEGDKDLNKIFGIDKVNAEIAPPGKSTTPFLAYYNGREYKIENDILFGRPNSFFESYDMGEWSYRDGRIGPDLYKITSPVKAYDGKLRFQIQEIEPEESFFKWINIFRVAHKKESEVVVDVELKKFFVLDKKGFEKHLILPSLAKVQGEEGMLKEISDKESLWEYDPKKNSGALFNIKEGIEILFKNLRKSETTYLISKTWYRDWVPKEEKSLQEVIAGMDMRHFFDMDKLNKITKVAAPLSIISAILLARQFGPETEVLSVLPLIIGSGSMCVPTPDCSCFAYSYKDEEGNYEGINIHGVRSWKYNMEIIELPREAVTSEGNLTVHITAEQKHKLGFLGAIQENDLARISEKNYRVEKPKLLRARHERTGEDYATVLSNKSGRTFMQTIPGDKVDLEFEAPKNKISDSEKETYLIRSMGFYIPLRSEAKKLAGNWKERASPEARERLEAITSSG